MDDLVRCGKIRYYGYSNVCGWQLQKIVDTAKHLGLNPCISLQVPKHYTKGVQKVRGKVRSYSYFVNQLN